MPSVKEEMRLMQGWADTAGWVGGGRDLQARASYGPRVSSTTCALRLFLGGLGLSLGKEARIQSRAFQMNDAMFCFSETCLTE